MKYSDYFENKRHGSLYFPIQYYYIDSNNPQYVMAAHWHKEFEIIRVLKGEFSVFIGNVEHLLRKGDILFVECGCLHRGEPKDSIYECIVLNLNMLCRRNDDAATKLISPFIHSSVAINSSLSGENSEILSTVNLLFDTMRREEKYYELAVYSLLYKLFSQLYLQNSVVAQVKSQVDKKTEAVTRVLGWIEKNFTETITLDMLSEFSGLSPKYLCRIFKEYTSKTLVNYINELRIENACHEMTVKGKNITQAAFDSGFNDLSYFCKTFKKHKGITPREYQKQG